MVRWICHLLLQSRLSEGAWFEGLADLWSWLKDDVASSILRTDEEGSGGGVASRIASLCSWSEDEDEWMKFHAEIPCQFVPKHWEVARHLSKIERGIVITSMNASSRAPSLSLPTTLEPHRSSSQSTTSDSDEIESKGNTILNVVADKNSDIDWTAPSNQQGQRNAIDMIQNYFDASALAWFNLSWFHHALRHAWWYQDHSALYETIQRGDQIREAIIKKRVQSRADMSVSDTMIQWSSQLDAFPSSIELQSRMALDKSIGEYLLGAVQHLEEYESFAQQTYQQAKDNLTERESTTMQIRQISQRCWELFMITLSFISGFRHMVSSQSHYNNDPPDALIPAHRYNDFQTVFSFAQGIFGSDQVQHSLTSAYSRLDGMRYDPTDPNSTPSVAIWGNPLQDVIPSRQVVRYKSELECSVTIDESIDRSPSNSASLLNMKSCRGENPSVSITDTTPMIVEKIPNATVFSPMIESSPSANHTPPFVSIAQQAGQILKRNHQSSSEEIDTSDDGNTLNHSNSIGWIFTSMLDQYDANGRWSFQSWIDPLFRHHPVSGSLLASFEDRLWRQIRTQWETADGPNAPKEEKPVPMDLINEDPITSSSLWQTQRERFTSTGRPLSSCRPLPDYFETLQFWQNTNEWVASLNATPIGTQGVKASAEIHPLIKMASAFHAVIGPSERETSAQPLENGDLIGMNHASMKTANQILPFGIVFRAMCQPYQRAQVPSEEKYCSDPTQLHWTKENHDKKSENNEPSWIPDDWSVSRHPILSRGYALFKGAQDQDHSKSIEEGLWEYAGYKTQYFTEQCLPKASEGLFQRRQFPFSIDQADLKRGSYPDGIPPLFHPLGLTWKDARPIDDCLPFMGLLLMDPAYDVGEHHFQMEDCELSTHQDDAWNQYGCFPMNEQDSMDNLSMASRDHLDVFKCRENAIAEECYWCTSKFIDRQLDTFDTLCSYLALETTEGSMRSLRSSGNLICHFVDLYLDDSSVHTYATRNSMDLYTHSQLPSHGSKYWDGDLDIRHQLSEILFASIQALHSSDKSMPSMPLSSRNLMQRSDNDLQRILQASLLTGSSSLNDPDEGIEPLDSSPTKDESNGYNAIVRLDTPMMTYQDHHTLHLVSSDLIRLAHLMLRRLDQIEFQTEDHLRSRFWLTVIIGILVIGVFTFAGPWAFGYYRVIAIHETTIPVDIESTTHTDPMQEQSPELLAREENHREHHLSNVYSRSGADKVMKGPYEALFLCCTI